MNKNSGFNIIELLVVIIIIGILSALAIPQYTKTVERSRQSEAFTNLAAIRGAQIRYYLEKANYTSNFDNLDIDNVTTGAYFNYTALNTDPIIASAQRNLIKNPEYGQYNITIAVNGTINKTNCLPPPIGCP